LRSGIQGAGGACATYRAMQAAAGSTQYTARPAVDCGASRSDSSIHRTIVDMSPIQSKWPNPVYSSFGSHVAAPGNRCTPTIGALFMTVHAEQCAGCALRETCPQFTRLTRRAFSASVVAATIGAAVAVNDGLAASGATSTAGAAERCPQQQAASDETAGTEVIIENFTFSPNTLTVPVGTEVTWENRDDIPHTVTSNDKTTFASTLLDTGDTFSFTFEAAGTFDYFCSVHPMMTAKVVVQG
jgi:plastocyanin